MNSNSTSIWIIVAALALAACGAAATPAASAEASSTAWKDMTGAQRATFMDKTVVPKMGGVMHEFSAKDFPKVTCPTCHGAGAKAGNFKMPNPDLPKLNTAGGFKKHLDKDPAMTQFMMDKVVPQMAGLLGMAPYDPQTHKGFGCFGCHTEEK